MQSTRDCHNKTGSNITGKQNCDKLNNMGENTEWHELAKTQAIKYKIQLKTNRS